MGIYFPYLSSSSTVFSLYKYRTPREAHQKVALSPSPSSPFPLEQQAALSDQLGTTPSAQFPPLPPYPIEEIPSPPHPDVSMSYSLTSHHAQTDIFGTSHLNSPASPDSG